MATKNQDRWYQEEAAKRVFEDIESSQDCHPVVVAPTATGKTHIIAKIIDKVLNKYPEFDVLVLCDEANVLKQDYDTLCDYFSDAVVGLYSAGLDSREISKITVAGIQSVYRMPEKFQNCLIVIIDEAHAINIKDAGMYRKFLNKIKANYIGLTATNFRTGHGYIHEGKGALFNKISYDMSSPEIFKRLQDEGWLSIVLSKGTYMRLDAEKEGVGIRGGEYKLEELSDKFDREEITKSCCDETIEFAKKAKRKKWLIFAIDIKHAENITKYLISKGIKADSVHSEKPNKNEIIKAYKNDELDAIVNVNILVKGFDEPRIDLIVILRSSNSPIFHVQSTGRGLRVFYADGFDLTTIEGRLNAIKAGPKQNCIVLDFPGNTDRLGPIDNPVIKIKGEKKNKSGPMVKECPECQLKNHLATRICINCGFEFEFKTNLNMFASDAELTSIKVNNRDDLIFKKWLDVTEVKYSPIYYQGKIKAIKIIYCTEEMDFQEKIRPDSKSYKGKTAEFWIKKRWVDNIVTLPNNAKDLWMMRNNLLKPTRIFVDVHKKYKNIQDYDLAQTPINRPSLPPKRLARL